MTPEQAERLVKALERIADALDALDASGLFVTTALDGCVVTATDRSGKEESVFNTWDNSRD